MPGQDESGFDPFLGLNYKVEIDGIQVAAFADCSGLSVETEMFEYAEGGWNDYTHKLPVRTKFGNLTLKRGLESGQELYDWFKQGMSGEPAPRHDVTITVMKPDLTTATSWRLIGAYPVKWSGPDLKAEAGAVAYESLELAYKYVQIESGSQSRS